MLITVEDDLRALVDLLWIREAWSLRPVGGDLPPLLSDRSVGAHTETDISGRIGAWQDAWPAMWEACLQHAGRVRDEAMFEQLAGTADGSAERVSLAALIPAWHAGMSTIVVIPCLGSYTRVIGQHALVVTSETRDDPNRYGQALKQFR